MIFIALGAYFLFSISPYARGFRYNIIESGETYLSIIDENVVSFEQAYRESINLAEVDAPLAKLTDYGTQVHSEGTEYYFVFKNIRPSIFIRRTHEYDVLRVWTDPWHKSFLSFCQLGYDSPFSEFKPLVAPISEVDSQKVIKILHDNTDLNVETVEYYYIGTHFLTDLPEISDPGGDTWAVQILIGDQVQFYTVNISEGTAVLIKTVTVENEV